MHNIRDVILNTYTSLFTFICLHVLTYVFVSAVLEDPGWPPHDGT